MLCAMTATFEVLLEFGGSRLPLTVTAETLHSAVKEAANVDVVLPGADLGRSSIWR